MNVNKKIYTDALIVFTVDHILLLRADNELIDAINPNPGEVKSFEFVPLSSLSDLKPDSLTPWFRLILKMDLMNLWIEEIKLMESQNSQAEFNLTRFSKQPVLRLN